MVDGLRWQLSFLKIEVPAEASVVDAKVCGACLLVDGRQGDSHTDLGRDRVPLDYTSTRDFPMGRRQAAVRGTLYLSFFCYYGPIVRNFRKFIFLAALSPRMRKYILILAVASLLLCSALIAGCATTNTFNATATPTSIATALQTTGGTAGQGTTIDLTAQNFAFDKSTITVPAGAQITVNLRNMDSGAPHNFAVYTDASAATTIFKGPNVNGPGTTTYTFTAPSTPGTYFFRCDVHPTTMTGSLIVT